MGSPIKDLPFIWMAILTAYHVAGDQVTVAGSGCSDAPFVNNSRRNFIPPLRDNVAAVNTKAYYSCERGFKLKDEEQVSLYCDGQDWIGIVPECLEKLVYECSTPIHIEYGYYSVFSNGVQRHTLFVEDGMTAQYFCENGYRMIGEFLLTCVKGHWNRDPPSCVSITQKCEPGEGLRSFPSREKEGHLSYNFEGAHKDPEGRYLEGSSIYFFCHDGYRTEDELSEGSMTCQGGEWVGAKPNCYKVNKCQTPSDIPNGNWYILDTTASSSKFYKGTRIRYECDQGYRMYGASDAQCQSSGYWTEYNPRCVPEELYCSDPGEVPNGRYKCLPILCDMFKVDTQVHYVCDEGYEPMGDVLQKCSAGGNWSGDKPICTPVNASQDLMAHMDINSSTMTIVIATSCSVLGLLLAVMIIVALQRKKSGPRLCHGAPPPPPAYTRPRTDSVDEHDRVALIAFADGVQVVLPSYDEATTPGGRSTGRFSDLHANTRGVEYRPLPSIHHSMRGRPDSIRSVPPLPNRHESHRNSTVTINSTSTATRDNTSMSVSLPFGSMDTMNVSDGTSNSVTIETYDSGASNPSLALSQRATAGSLGSSNGSLANEDAPLLEHSNRDNSDSVRLQNSRNSQNDTSPTIEEEVKID